MSVKEERGGQMRLRIDHYLHHGEQDQIAALLKEVLKLQGGLMLNFDILNQVIADIGTAVGQFGPAIDEMEARITAALKDTGIPADAQEKIDSAVAQLRNIATAVEAAMADAKDGVDEADVPAQPPVEEPPVEQPPVEQPPVEQPPVEEPPVEQPPVEEPPVVSEPPAGEFPSEQ